VETPALRQRWQRLTLLILAIGLALGVVGSAAFVARAEAHQDGCHRWHSCPSDTGSYVCGDLGYPCIYPTYPSPGSPPPTPPPAPTPDDYGQSITRAEFRSWAKIEIRGYFGDVPRGFWMNRCVGMYTAKARCRVHWRADGSSWVSKLTIRESLEYYNASFHRV
jgi:hypothetical protein